MKLRLVAASAIKVAPSLVVQGPGLVPSQADEEIRVSVSALGTDAVSERHRCAGRASAGLELRGACT